MIISYSLCRPHTHYQQPVGVMTFVKEWKELKELGDYVYGLGVPDAVIDKIKSNTAYPTEEERKETLLVYYLHTVARASWQTVAGVPHRREEVTALKAVNTFLESTPASELIFWGTEYIVTNCPGFSGLSRNTEACPSVPEKLEIVPDLCYSIFDLE